MLSGKNTQWNNNTNGKKNVGVPQQWEKASPSNPAFKLQTLQVCLACLYLNTCIFFLVNSTIFKLFALCSVCCSLTYSSILQGNNKANHLLFFEVVYILHVADISLVQFVGKMAPHPGQCPLILIMLSWHMRRWDLLK